MEEDFNLTAKKHGFKLDSVSGMKFNLLFKKWNESRDSSVNYISTFLKN